jgi:NAD(P)-dependent dehydrogenase (short-subunit alcohol dehydrogenase family)
VSRITPRLGLKLYSIAGAKTNASLVPVFIGTNGRNVTGVQGDASNLEDLDRLYKTVQKEQGRIDVLFASVGQGEFTKLEEVTEPHFDKTFAANVRGTLFTV